MPNNDDFIDVKVGKASLDTYKNYTFPYVECYHGFGHRTVYLYSSFLIIWTNGYIFDENVEDTIRNRVNEIIHTVGLDVTSFNVSTGGTSPKGNGEIYQMSFDEEKIKEFVRKYEEMFHSLYRNVIIEIDKNINVSETSRTALILAAYIKTSKGLINPNYKLTTYSKDLDKIIDLFNRLESTDNETFIINVPDKKLFFGLGTFSTNKMISTGYTGTMRDPVEIEIGKHKKVSIRTVFNEVVVYNIKLGTEKDEFEEFIEGKIPGGVEKIDYYKKKGAAIVHCKNDEAGCKLIGETGSVFNGNRLSISFNDNEAIDEEQFFTERYSNKPSKKLLETRQGKTKKRPYSKYYDRDQKSQDTKALENQQDISSQIQPPPISSFVQPDEIALPETHSYFVPPTSTGPQTGQSMEQLQQQNQEKDEQIGLLQQQSQEKDEQISLLYEQIRLLQQQNQEKDEQIGLLQQQNAQTPPQNVWLLRKVGSWFGF